MGSVGLSYSGVLTQTDAYSGKLKSLKGMNVTSVSVTPGLPIRNFSSVCSEDRTNSRGFCGQFDLILVNVSYLIDHWLCFLQDCSKLLHENGELHIIDLDISINDPNWYHIKGGRSIKDQIGSWESQSVQEVLGEVMVQTDHECGCLKGEQRGIALNYAQDVYLSLRQNPQGREQSGIHISAEELVFFCW